MIYSQISILGPLLIVGTMLLIAAEGNARYVADNRSTPIRTVFIALPLLWFVEALIFIPPLDATAVSLGDFADWPFYQKLIVFSWLPYTFVRVAQLLIKPFDPSGDCQ